MSSSARIDEHGLVGDLRTTALITNAGAVDSLCLPDADSPSVFASLLDGAGGHLTIDLVEVPEGEEMRRRQHYLPNTNILMTRLQGAGAITQIRDFMLPLHLAQDRVGVLVRQVTALHGPRSLHFSCWPGFDYARADHQARATALDLHEQLSSLLVRHGWTPGTLEISVLRIDETADR